MISLAIIKERKTPPDQRVVLSPKACKDLLQHYPDLQIKIESSDIRTFSDQEYLDAGLEVSTDITDCDVMIGVKEVPIENLIPNKKYFFFSHTIKKQPYNRNLLRAILNKNIEFFDHEVLTNEHGTRVVAFGRYAGIVGAYNGIRAYGLKESLFELPKAQTLKNRKELIEKLNEVKLPAIKIVLSGKGRVGNGSKEILDAIGIKEVNVHDYINKTFPHAVYVQIDVLDYNKRKDGKIIDAQDFFDNPSAYESDFMRFAKVSDFYIAGHFFGNGSPYIFTRSDAKSNDFKIKVVADISCDIDGPVACTIKASTVANPIYGYDPITEQEVDFKNPNAIAVMAVDNLPSELPHDASIGFGESFTKHVIPAFFNQDKNGILSRARMTKDKKLTERYQYLQDYVDGNSDGN